MSLTGGFMNDVAKSLIKPDIISPDAIVTPLERMNEELKQLIELRDKAFTSEGWQVGDVLVRQKQKEIAAYKGEGKEEKKENKSVVGGIERLTGSMSQMVSGMEQLGIEVPSEIRGVVSGIQGVTTILTAIASIVSAIEIIVGATSFIPFFARGGVVPHAAGGLNVVPGNSFSGDLIPVMANAGEVVLNRAQTNTIANFLEGGGASQRVEVEGFISGENIRLALRNNGLRAGRGEYVMTKRM